MNFGGRYEIRRELGRGAMGIVYLCHDTRIDRPVALKCLNGNGADMPKAVQERFKKEILALGRLSHPNIVTIFDVGEDAGRAYIVMEYVDGRPLSQWIREGADIPSWMDIGVQICRALDVAHKRSIIHRDIKPANILIETNTKAVKIADFGIARVDMGEQTRTLQLRGTPQYMSPEQCKGESLDGRSDLFSAGAVLYEVATRRKPFAGEDPMAILYQVLHNTPDAPHTISPDISPAISDVIMKALAKNPAERFQSGEEMARALEEAAIQPGPIQTEQTVVMDRAGSVKKRRLLQKVYIVGAVIVPIVAALAVWGIRAWPRPSSSDRMEQLPITPSPSIPRLGKVDVSTEPSGADIWINGEPKGAAPLTMELPAGDYELTVTKERYHTVEATLTVVAGQQNPLELRLIPKEEPP